MNLLLDIDNIDGSATTASLNKDPDSKPVKTPTLDLDSAFARTNDEKTSEFDGLTHDQISALKAEKLRAEQEKKVFFIK
mgnify:CR=1 FL=1